MRTIKTLLATAAGGFALAGCAAETSETQNTAISDEIAHVAEAVETVEDAVVEDGRAKTDVPNNPFAVPATEPKPTLEELAAASDIEVAKSAAAAAAATAAAEAAKADRQAAAEERKAAKAAAESTTRLAEILAEVDKD